VNDQDAPKGAGLSFLRPYPFSFIDIVLESNSIQDAVPAKIIGRFPRFSFDESEAVSSSTTFNDQPVTIFVTESCKNLNAVARSQKSLAARMYSNVRSSTRNSLSVGYSHMLKSRAFQSLFSDSERKGELTVITGSSSRSKGFRIPGVYDGRTTGGSQSVTTRDTRSVAVSESIFREIVSRESEQIALKDFSEGATTSEMEAWRRQIGERLVGLLIERMEALDLSVQRLNDGVFQLSGDRVSAVLSKEQLNELLESDMEQNSASSEKTTLQVPDGSEVSREDQGSLMGKSGIKWQSQDGVWIPVSAHLVAVSEMELELNRVMTLASTVLSQDVKAQVVRLEPVSSTVRSQFEEFFKGPAKNIRTAPAGFIETRVYYKDGRPFEQHWCAGGKLEGYEFVAAPGIRPFDSRSPNPTEVADSGKCLPSSFVRGPTVDFVVSFLRDDQSCFVDQGWFRWYQTQLVRVGGAVAYVYACDKTIPAGWQQP
jgi:hypothetical protein